MQELEPTAGLSGRFSRSARKGGELGRRSFALGLGAGLAAAGGGARAETAAPDWTRPLAGGALARFAAFPSRAIGPRAVSVWTPRGYPAPGVRYAALYMADGQNLFLPQEAYGGRTWGVAEHLQALIDAGEARPALIVGVANALAARGQEYAPDAGQGPVGRAALAADWGGPSTADRYVAFLGGELKPFVDRAYATDPRLGASALMGSSLGAVISLYAFARRPDLFGAVAGLSTHWPLRLPQAMEAGADAAPEAQGFLRWLDAHLPPVARRWRDPDAAPGVSRRAYLDHGTATLDALYAPWQARADALFARHGYVKGEALTSLVFPGAAHDEAAWRARVDAPLRTLLGVGSAGAAA